MKKHLLTLMAVFVGTATFGQSFKEDPDFALQAPNAVSYMLDTVSESTFSKDQLYSNALSFLTSRFKYSSSRIVSKDLDLGEITCKGTASTYVVISDTTKKGKISNKEWKIGLGFECKVYVKEKKFKVILHSMDLQPIYGWPGISFSPYDKSGSFPKENQAVSLLAVSIIKELAEYLNKKPNNDF